MYNGRFDANKIFGQKKKKEKKFRLRSKIYKTEKNTPMLTKIENKNINKFFKKLKSRKELERGEERKKEGKEEQKNNCVCNKTHAPHSTPFYNDLANP